MYEGASVETPRSTQVLSPAKQKGKLTTNSQPLIFLHTLAGKHVKPEHNGQIDTVITLKDDITFADI